MQRQNTDQILEYYYEEEAGPRPPRTEPPSDNRRLHIVELDPDLGRRFDPSRIALVAPAVSTPAIGESKQIGDKVGAPVTVAVDPWSSRGAPPPRPPRLSSPKPKSSPSTSFRSLAAPIQLARGNSDYSIVAVSDSSTSERATPVDEQPTSHTREAASHSVFTSQSQSTDGLPEPSSTDRTFDNRMPALDEDDETSSRPRSGTITSRSTNHTSAHSHYTQSSKSHYTQSSKSHYTDDMQDLIATVGSALTDMGLDIGDLPPAHVVAPPDDDKPSPRHSVDVRSAGSPRTSTSIPRGSPRTSLSELARSNRGSPRPSMQELARGTDSPRPSMSDITSDFARGSPRPSVSDLARGSPRQSVAEFPRSRPASIIERSSLSRANSPEKRRMRDLSPEKPRLVDAVRAREASPEKGSRERERAYEKSSRETPHRDEKSSRASYDKSRDASHEKGSRERAMSPEGSMRTNHRFSPDLGSGRRSPDKRSVPTITRSSGEYPGTALSSPRSAHTHMGSVHAGSSHHPASPRTTSSPQIHAGSPQTHAGSPQTHTSSPHTHTSSPHAHPSSPRTPRTMHASPRSPTSPRGSSMHQPPPEGIRYRQPGAPMPESFHFADVLKLKTSAERAQGYVRKINQLATEDSGLGYWVGYMKGRVRTETSPQVPTSPTPMLTTFGPHGPGTRRQQPRHVSGGSTTSEATFAVRPDAYVATNISVRSASPPLGTPASLPYPSLAKDIGIRAVDSRPGAVKAKVNTVGFFSSIGRKASTRRERDRTVMQQARKPHVLRTGTTGTTYAELPSPSKQVQLSAPPTIPGGPRARSDRGGSSRASVIMIGGRDSFQTMSPSGDGSVSIRVPSSNGHGVVTPNLPPLSPGLGDMSSMYSRDRESLYGGAGGSIGGSTIGGGSALGHGGSAIGHGSVVGHSTGGGSVSGHGSGGGGLDQLADVLPHVDRSVLAGYLDRAGGHEIDAISAYLEDEKRMNAVGR